MEKMSFRFGINNYICYNNPILRENDIFDNQNPTEKKDLRKYNIGEKNK